MPLLRHNVKLSCDCNINFFFKSNTYSDCTPYFSEREITFPGFIWWVLGVLGVGILIYPTLVNVQGFSVLKGITIAFLGTILTAVGDASSARNANKKIDPVYANAIGFTVGSMLMVIIILFQGQSITIPTTVTYLSALLYLTLIASFIAWLFYLKLVEKIGGAKSGYMLALFPAIGGIASVLIGETAPSIYLFVGCLSSCLGAAIALGFRLKRKNVDFPVNAN